jgi:hypothetical protein
MSAKSFTASGIIATTPPPSGGKLWGVMVLNDDVALCDIKIYDHASAASGNILFARRIAADTSDTFEIPRQSIAPYENGLYLELSNATNICVVAYYD